MKRSKIIGSIIFWLLTAAVMYIIFSFSSETGEQSKEVSEGVLSIIIEYLGNIVSHNVLRKIAHFTEYAALGFCMSGAICFTFSKNKFDIPLIPCVLFAVSDEIHQYFVPERACRVFDVFVDSCGSSVGILIFLLIVFLIRKHKKQKVSFHEIDNSLFYCFIFCLSRQRAL